MDHEQAFSQVVAILKRFARDQEALAKATPQTTFLRDLRVNSARLVDIVIELQKKFGVDLTDDEADRMRTVGDAVSILMSKLGAK
jgi:acyl carrier protein